MDTLNIENILVPVDFSEASFHALDTAAGVAKRQGARLTLLHVVNQNLLSYGHFDVLPAAAPVLEAMRGESSESIRQLIENLTDKHGIEADGVIAHGFVPAEICKSAENILADMIVMGTHGVSGFREFFIGSNAYSVVKHAPCPVLTVPPNKAWNSFSRILFPIRNTNGALEKYTFLRKIIRKNNAMLLVLGLPDKDPATSNWVEDNVEQLKRDLQFDEVRSRTQILEPTERAAAEVLETAERENADLIAITASLDHDIRDFFVGPYTQQIVNHAKIPVLSIRPAKRPDVTPETGQTIQTGYGPSLPGLSLQYMRVAMGQHPEAP